MAGKAEEWVDQESLLADAKVLSDWADSHPNEFGGLWFANHDERLKSQIVMALVGGDEGRRRHLRRLVRHHAALRFVEHRWPYRELLRLQDELSDRIFDMRPADGAEVYVSGVSVDVVGNCVEVTLSAPNDALQRAVLALAPGRVKVAYAVFRAV
jgi:hypothetical protein